MENKKLLDLVNKAIENKNDKALRKEIGYAVGSFDSGNRYRVIEQYTTESSNNIRGPSRRWNLSEWKHVQTTKYLKQLKEKLSNEVLNETN